MALGRVGLAQVVHERPDMVRVTGSQSFQGAAGADRADLVVVAHGDELGPGGLDRSQQPAHVGVRGHRVLSAFKYSSSSEEVPFKLSSTPTFK